MKKTITFLSLCFLVLISCSKLDAFFAIAVACEQHGHPSQSAYKYAYGPESGLLALQKAQIFVQRDLMEIGIRDGKSWNVFLRDSSKNTGDFTIPHGFFAIVWGIAANFSEKGASVTAIGAGVDVQDPATAIYNAIKDMHEALQEINANVLVGAFEPQAVNLLKLGQF